MAARPAPEKRKIQACLRGLLADGVTESGQLEGVNEEDPTWRVSLRELRTHRAEILNNEIEQIQGTSPHEAFVRLRLRQDAVVRDLDTIIKRVTLDIKAGPGKMTAAVNALKAKSDIISNVFKAGRDLGLIQPVKEDSLVIGGVVVSQLTVVELKQVVATKLNELEEMATTKGFTDFLALEDDTPIYYSLDPGGTEEGQSILDIEPSSVEDEEILEEDDGVVRTPLRLSV